MKKEKKKGYNGESGYNAASIKLFTTNFNIISFPIFEDLVTVA